jgi:hypothetical protein
MKAQFDTKFAAWYEAKKAKYIVDSIEGYQARLIAVRKTGTDEKFMSINEKNWAKSLSIREIDGVQKLFHGNKRLIVCEEVWDILHESHHRLGHGGRNIMDNDLASYHGLSK